MKKAYMTFPDGGRIYKDAAGHLLAYISVGGRAERKRVKKESEGERWLARTFLAGTPGFLPDLPPEIREMNLRLKWRREVQLETEVDPARRQALAKDLSFIRLQGYPEETPEIAAELDLLRPNAAVHEPGAEDTRVLSRAERRDAFAALDLLHAKAPGKTLVDAVMALLATGGAAPAAAAAVQAYLAARQGAAPAAEFESDTAQARRFVAAFPGLRIDEVRRADAVALDTDPCPAGETSPYMAFLARFSGFALGNGWIRRGYVRAEPKKAPEPTGRTALTLGEVARTLVAVFARTPDILEPVVYELFCSADPATALEMVARRRKGRPVANSPVVDKWLKIVRKAETPPPGAGPAVPTTTDPRRLARRTAEALRAADIDKGGADLLLHTGNAFLWRREVARGNGEDAAMRMKLPRRTCEKYYSSIDIAPLDIGAFFELTPFNLAQRFLANPLAKLRAGGAIAPADRDRPMGETLRRLAPPAGGDWSAAASIARDLAAFNPAFRLYAQA